MNSLRTILADLVDRRLWPVALALVAALVAVPVMLGGGSHPSSSAADPAAAAPAASPVAQAAISVSTPSTARQNRPGAVRNPFKQHEAKPAPDASANTQPTTPATTPTYPVTPSYPVGGGLPSYPITPAVPGSGGGRRDDTPANVWRVNLRFGDAGNQKVRHDIPRLTPLPSMTDPFFIFLGVLSDHKTAVFLISSDATATGDGTCKPNPDQCDTIEMKAGDTEFFDVAQGNAGIVQYELDLLKVFKDKVSSSAAAARAARRVSKSGKNVVHELKAEGDDSMERYIYSYKRGVLVRRHGLDVEASASSSGSAADSGAHSSAFAVPTWGNYPQ
jgi:hypothetical protein